MGENVDREAAIRHGQSVSNSSIAFWDQTRKVTLFFGEENLKRFAIDSSRHAGEIVMGLRTSLGDFTYDPSLKTREVVGYMSQLNQIVLSSSKQVEDVVVASGLNYRNYALQAEVDIMNDQKRRFVATMSLLGEWLKFQRDRMNKPKVGGPPSEAQYLQQQEAKRKQEAIKREEALKAQQYQDWLKTQDEERRAKEDQIRAREREEMERRRIYEEKQRDEERRLQELFQREKEEAARREDQRLQDLWKAKRQSVKIEEEPKKNKDEIMARLQKSGSSSRSVSGRNSPVPDKHQEDLADELLKELGVTFSDAPKPLTHRRPSANNSRTSLNVDELLNSVSGAIITAQINHNSSTLSRNPSTSSSLSKSSSFSFNILSPPSSEHRRLSPSSSSSSSCKEMELPTSSAGISPGEDPWDSLEKLADSISKRNSVSVSLSGHPSPRISSSRFSTVLSRPQLENASPPMTNSPSIPRGDTKSALDSLLESMEAQVYPPNSPSDGQYRRSLLGSISAAQVAQFNAAAEKEKEKEPLSRTISNPVFSASNPVSPTLTSPTIHPKEGGASLSWRRDQSISTSNSIEEIMSQLSVGEMRSSMRINSPPPAMVNPFMPKKAERQSVAVESMDDLNKKISDLELKKKAAVSNEDYALASTIKEEIDQLKAVVELRAMESPAKRANGNTNSDSSSKSEIDDLIRDLESL